MKGKIAFLQAPRGNRTVPNRFVTSNVQGHVFGDKSDCPFVVTHDTKSTRVAITRLPNFGWLSGFEARRGVAG